MNRRIWIGKNKPVKFNSTGYYVKLRCEQNDYSDVSE